MLALPAQLAGCKRIVLCTPPQADGTIHPAILFAASISGGVTDLFAVRRCPGNRRDGIWNRTIPAVDKIFGPGNRFVTEAKIRYLPTHVP
jgi:histidinol dehydrogenase